METQQRQRRHQLRTPIDPILSFAGSLLSAFSPSSPTEQGAAISTILLLPLPVAAARALSVLRRLALLATQAFISVFFAFLSALSPPPPPPPPSLTPSLPPPHQQGSSAAAAGTSSVGRALGHVLWVASRLPVASRKYELVRGLAERLLDDDNVSARVAAVSRAALSGAFERTLRQLEASAAGGNWPAMELAARAVRTGVRWWRPTEAVAPLEGEAFGGPAAEKLAAELLWLAQKMAACCAAREATVQFGAAPRLGSRALVAEPTLQVALLRLAVFLFRHANSAEFEQHSGDKEGDKAAVAEHRMAMLRSWLPLLCRGSNGTDAPVLSGRERAEMVTVLEELIEKLRWEQQEEALALWLHHFAACPDTDWPNLEGCYTRWYAESRKLLA
uniref:Uncharacterized protein n=1 Tax=Avena sativa TaxID=4498 RepID=A0ACD5Z3X9_AVESA